MTLTYDRLRSFPLLNYTVHCASPLARGPCSASPRLIPTFNLGTLSPSLLWAFFWSGSLDPLQWALPGISPSHHHHRQHRSSCATSCIFILFFGFFFYCFALFYNWDRIGIQHYTYFRCTHSDLMFVDSRRRWPPCKFSYHHASPLSTSYYQLYSQCTFLNVPVSLVNESVPANGHSDSIPLPGP